MTISGTPSISRIFDRADLLPRLRLDHADEGPRYVESPSIIRFKGNLVMAYAVIDPDLSARIAMCRLRDDWTVVEDSVSTVSDQFVFADNTDVQYQFRMTDPRLVALGGRLYTQFCTGYGPIPNQTYLIEIDDAVLRPIGIARIVIRAGCHGAVERHWSFFEYADEILVIEQLAPVTILRADVSDPHCVTLTDLYIHHWDSWSYENAYGALSPGVTPIRRNGHIYVVGHSEYPGDASVLRPDSETRCHVGALVMLADEPPFAPEFYSARPLIELSSPERDLPRPPHLASGCVEIGYPSGLVSDDSGLTVSYGINNADTAVRRIDWASLALAVIPAVPRSPASGWTRAWVACGGQGAAQPDAAQRAEQGAMTVRAFWWRPGHVSPRSTQRAANLAQHRFVHGNFGDLFASHLLGRLTGVEPQFHEDNPKLITVGSVIRTARDGDVLWGTGLNGGYPQMIHGPGQLHIYATRGPISFDFLKRGGFDVSRVGTVFDPGSLVGHLFQTEIAALRRHIGAPERDFILIPHFRDDTVMRELYSRYADRIYSVDAPFFETVSEILRSKLVISSSLHGLIIAEALGVPAIWHRSPMGVDELKFTDYYLGTGRYRILRVDTLQDAFKSSPMALPVLDAAAMLATFPSFADLKSYGVIV